jgi:hypothetical protein
MSEPLANAFPLLSAVARYRAAAESVFALQAEVRALSRRLDEIPAEIAAASAAEAEARAELLSIARGQSLGEETIRPTRRIQIQASSATDHVTT